MTQQITQRTGFSRLDYLAALLVVALPGIGLALWLPPSGFGAQGVGQGEKAARPLLPGQAVERELAGGQVHTYHLALTAGQFLQVVVEQRGIDVAVITEGPGGQRSAEINRQDELLKNEVVWLLAETDGEFRLLVRAADATSATGRYRVRIVESRTATEPDRRRIAAQQAFAEGEQLLKQPGKARQQEAIKLHETALAHWRALSDRLEEATSLYRLGQLHAGLGARQQAVDYYLQALALVRALADHAKEALVLNNLGIVYRGLNKFEQAEEAYLRSVKIKRELGDVKGEARTLQNLGTLSRSRGQLKQALDYYEQALPLRRAGGDRAGEAITLNAIGFVHADLSEHRKALDYYKQALPLSRAAGDRITENNVLNNLGVSHSRLGERQQAIEYHTQALQLRREMGDQGGEAQSLGNIGVVYSDMGEVRRSLEYFQPSLAIVRALGDQEGEAYTLGNLGMSYRLLSEMPKALEYYEQALRIYRARNNREGQARLLSSIGSVYNALGEARRALEYFQQALPLRRGNRSGEAVTLGNIGVAYRTLGENAQALAAYQEALAIARAIADRDSEATTLSNLGALYSDSGENQQALDCHLQALALSRAVRNQRAEAQALGNIGAVYSDMGERRQALDFYAQALRLRNAAGDQVGEALSLNNIGQASLLLDQPEAARARFTQALELARAVGDRAGEASAFQGLAGAAHKLGESRLAVTHYQQALALRRALGQRAAEATTLVHLGIAHHALRETGQALDCYQQALALHRGMGNRAGTSFTLYHLARLERERGALETACAYLEESLTLAETLRANVVSQELRAAYFATVQELPDLYREVLMQLHRQAPAQGHDLAAFQLSERARARSLLEMLAEARAEIGQGAAPELLAHEKELQQRLNHKATALLRLKSDRQTETPTAEIEKALGALTQELQQVRAEIRQASPRYAALTQPQPLPPNAIQQQLDAGTLLLEYALGKEHSYLWAVSTDAIKSYELPGRATLEDAARRVHGLLTARTKRVKDETAAQRRARIARTDKDFPIAAAALSRLLLAPVAAQLGAKRLLVVSDGALQYIPFAALPIPAAGRVANRPMVPLIAEHEVVHLPSASTLAVMRRELAGRAPAPKIAAVLADPVFEATDLRVKGNSAQPAASQSNTALIQESAVQPITDLTKTRALDDVFAPGQPIPRLNYSQREAAVIKALVPEAQRKLVLGFEVNYQTSTSPELSQYRIVHFATHGLLNSQHPELSGILLSLVDEAGREQERGLLRLGEIYNLKLPAELIVLSACQTALGKEVKGEGLVGLTRGFMYAGAARVMASLWKVDDLATAELMRRFYEGLLGPRQLRPAAALRAAQLAMWREKDWTAPYFWGAFTLQGEWK